MTDCCILQINAGIDLNILKTESQSEYSNPIHWKTKHVLPLQDCHCFQVALQFFLRESLVQVPAHRNNFILFHNGAESRFYA